MVFTDIGKSGTAIALGSYVETAGSWYIATGIGSASVSTARSGLITEFDRTTLTGSVDYTTINRVKMLADWNSLQISGTNDTTEFGVFPVVSGGKAYHIEGFTGINFDGTQELQIEVEWRVF